MASRYTKPVRFIYDRKGNVLAASQLRTQARKLIGVAFKSPERIARNGQLVYRKFEFPDGTRYIVQKVHGVINCTIYVPKKVDEEGDYFGFMTYPYMGWLYHARQYDHTYYDTAGFDARDLHRTLWQEWPGGYYGNQSHGWKPPYSENGNPITEDGKNIGSITLAEPAYPRWLLPKPSHKVIPKQAWKTKLVSKEGRQHDYRPDRDIEDWWSGYQTSFGLGGPNTQRDHERWYKTTGYWKSVDNKYHVHYEGHPGGDVGLVTESIATDGINMVYVNGIEYEVPMPVHAASVLQDVTATGTDWLICWINTDSWGEPGTDFQDSTASIIFCRIRNGKKPTTGKIWEPSAFAGLGTQAQEEGQYDWFTIDGAVTPGDTQDYVTGGLEPQIQTNKTHYDTYGEPSAQTHERWVTYPRQRISVDSTGATWLCTWVTDGGSGSQWNEFTTDLTVVKDQGDGEVVYIPSISFVYNEGANQLMTSDAIAWNSWINCGTITVNATYDELDAHKFCTFNLQLKVDGSNAFPADHDNMHNTTVDQMHVKTEIEFDGNIWYSNADTDFSTFYTGAAEWPVYYDIKTKDKVIEKMASLSITQWDPGVMAWDYERKVYIKNVLASTDTGSTSYTVPASAGVGYSDRPYLNFDNWWYTLPSGPWVWSADVYQWQYRCPAPFALYLCYFVPQAGFEGANLFGDYDTHPLDEWRPFWPIFYKNSEPPGFEVHALPGGHRMGFYVPRSLGNTGDYMDYTATTTYADGNDENFRVAPTYFIDGPQTVYQEMNLTGITDSEGKQMAPIIEVFYYRRKDQDIVTPWRIK